MNIVIILAALAAIGCSAIFLLAVRRRWFSKFENGFVLTLFIALAGIGFMAALSMGMWGYEAAKQILLQEVVAELQNVGGVIGANIDQEIAFALTRLGQLAEATSGHVTSKNRKLLEEELHEIEQFNRRFLQINVLDSQGTLVVSTSLGATDPVNRIAVAFALENKPFVSDAYVSPAFNKYILYLAVPVKGGGRNVGVLTARYDLQEALSALIGTTRFGETGYAMLTNNDGRILAHPLPDRVNEDISSYAAIQRARQGGAGGWMIAPNKAGEERLMVYHPLKSPATVNPKPWVLLTEMSESEALAAIRVFRYEFLGGIAVLTIICLLIAHQLSQSIKRPVQELLHFVGKVRGGDLSGQVAVEGRDEVGQLGGALNEMVHGLQERDRVKDVFGRYVATQVSEEILKGELNLGGELRRVTILFSDIRSFTAMSEQMAPVQVVAFLNDYFSEMVEAIFEQGGVLDKFMGDGLMAVFGSIGDMPDHPRRAVLAALRMKALLGKINGERSMAGKPPIAIGIGIHTDDVVVGNIGSRRRLEYTVIGDGVNTSSRVQALNKEFGTTVLITETTYQVVKDQFECRPMPEAHLRGKVKPLAFYEVLSVRAT